MINAIGTLTDFMVNSQRSFDVSANNLSNMNSTGFKKNLYIERGRVKGTYVDITPGEYRYTGNTLHAALERDKFFAVMTPQGVRYTRNGEFTINERNELVTLSGHRLIGQNGLIPPLNGNVQFDMQGNVYSQDVRIDSFMIVQPQNRAEIRSAGDGLFVFNAAPAQGERLIQPGTLEGSNVDPMAEMIGVISKLRSFDIGQRLVKMQDNLLGKVSNDIGRSGG